MVSMKRLKLLRQSNRVLALFLVILLFAGVVLAAEQSRPEPSASAQNNLKWSTSYYNSIQQAKAKDMPVLIKFEASWCVWCEKMEEEVFTEPEVIKELEKFVCINIDIDKQENVAKAYQIKSLPRTIVINTHDEIVGDWLGFREAPVFSKLLRDVEEFTHMQTGTTSMPDVQEVANTITQGQDIPVINPDNTDELISFLGHRNAGVCRRAVEILVETGPEILPKVVPALESKYLGTRIAAWKVVKELKPNQYEFDPWAPIPIRGEAAKRIKEKIQNTEQQS